MNLLGEKIARARSKINYTQEQFAETLEVNRQTISKWESSLAYPEASKLVKISKVLEVSIDYLLDDDLPIEQQPIISGTNESVTIDWTHMYPILISYLNEVDTKKYHEMFKKLFKELENEYNYSSEDAMLVAKDMMAKAYFDNLK